MYLFDLTNQEDLRIAASILEPLTEFEIRFQFLTIQVQGDMYRDILCKALDERKIQYAVDSLG